MLVFSDTCGKPDYDNKSDLSARVERIHNSTSKVTTSKRKKKTLNRKNINFLKSLGIVVKTKK